MTYQNTTSPWTPVGDYILDWDLRGSDGGASLASAKGDPNVSVTVSTPKNGDHDQFALSGGKLVSDDVTNATQTIVDFGTLVTDVNFQIEDVDQGHDWDDKVTILAYDEHGNLVDVDFDIQSGSGISQSGSMVEGGANPDGGTSGGSTKDNVTVKVAGPVSKIVIVHDNGSSDNESGEIKITDMGFNAVHTPEIEPDGIVENDDDGDLIDVNYTGDPHGDRIDANDAILPGESGDDDIVYAMGGDDTVLAGAGNDEVYAGAGDDYVEGGSGDDLIRGDSETRNGDAGSTREVFQWDQAPGYGDETDADGSFTQNTGTVNVTYSVYYSKHDADIEFEDNAGNVSGIDTGDLGAADQSSGLALEGDDKYDDAKVKLAFDQDVSNVAFRINDVDVDSSVTVYAYLDGVPVDVDLTGGSKVSVSGDTATATGGDAAATADQNSVLVSIAGPVDTIYVKHDIVGNDTSHVQITDVYFDSGVFDDDCLPDAAGNDTLLGGEGEDTIYGEGGDDIIDGGADDDVLYGDHGLVDGAPAETIRESFEWSKAPGFGNDQDAGNVTQNTGNMDVTFTVVHEDSGVKSVFETDDQNVSGIDTGGETINDNSSFGSEAGGKHNDSTYQFDFAAPVENVDFRINDIDGDGVVTVKAYDADGNQIDIDLTGGSKLTMLDTDGKFGVDTADSKGGYESDSSANYSLHVEIAGPVSKIVIVHDQNGYDNSGINITDVFFDTTAGTCVPDDEGDDTITGGAGSDTMYGEGGDDTFIVTGGADADGDIVTGGNGPDENTDHDVLDLTGAGRVTIDSSDDASDAGAITGTVTFSNGEILTFSQIEEIITDVQNVDPDAMDDTVTLDEDSPATVIPVLANDSDADGDPLEVIGVGPATNGTATLNPDGTASYEPNDDFTGTDTFTYTISDGQGGTDTATVTINVTNVNDAPDAVDDAAATDEDSPVTIDLTANDSDPDGDDLEILSVDTTGTNGVVTVNPDDDSVVYDPNGAYEGLAEGETATDTFTYTVTDGNGGTDVASVTVTITGVNDAPDAVDDSLTTDEDTPITFNPLDNDSDPDGDDLDILSADVDPAQGSVAFDPETGEMTFTPADDFTGAAEITYTITDGNGATDTATITIGVGAVNDTPDAVDDAAATDEDSPVTIDLTGNDSDPDGDDLEILSVDTTGTNGTVTVNPDDDSVVYDPNGAYEGLAEGETATDTFTYTVTDGNGGTDVASVTVTITGVNDAPDAVDDSLTTDEDTPITFNPLDNDSDPDGDDLDILSADVDPAQGSVTFDPETGEMTFTPADDFTGAAEITYTITDGNGATDTATITIGVGAVNDAPDAVDDAASTDEDTSIIVDVLANDSDPEGDDLEVTDVGTPSNGTAVLLPDGTVEYTPNPDFYGTDTFDYTVTDENGATDIATVTITVDPVNELAAKDDTADTDEDVSVIIDVTANDSDPDGDDFEVTAVGTPSNGTATLLPDGTIEYTPNPDFNGTDTFEYTITDENGATDTATVTVNIEPVNDAPDANDDAVTTDEDTAVTFDPRDNDEDVDGDPLDIIDTTEPSNGTVSENPDGTLTYTPDPGFDGTDTFDYTVSDGNGGTDVATVTIVVEPDVEPNSVDAVDDTYSIDPDVEFININVIENDSDPEGDDFSVTEVGTPSHGTAELQPDGTVNYAPEDGYTGTDTFTYTVTDEFGATDTATVTIEVCMGGGEDLPPIAGDDEGRTPINTAVVIPVLLNDIDPDGEDAALDVTTATSPDGTVEINPDGTITFTPATDFTGPATIEYTITDEDGLTDTATVTIMVNDGIVEGSDGDDVIDTSYTGDPEGDMVDAGDSIFPPVGSEDDIIEAYDGDDEIEAGNGDDIIYAGEGDDDVDAGDGDDTVYGGDGNDVVDGGNGDDVIDTSGTNPASDYGFTPGETVDNWPFAPLTPADLVPLDDDPNDDKDVVDGGAGNDTIYTGDDADVIDGGSGDDTIDGGLDDDDIDGGTGDDFIIGGHGSDDIDGGDGDDVIWGGLGPDEDDLLNIEDDANPVDDYGDADDNDPDSPIPTFLDPRPENGIDTIHGGEGNDTIYGQDDDDVLYGDEGDDTIDGGIDDDMIYGGLGNDVLIGGKGNDYIDAGDGILPGVEDDGVDTGEGGDDRDTFVNFGQGDTVDGGEGGDDWDTLNLIGSAPTGGSLKVDLSADNPENGVVEFFDEDGNSTGTMEFYNIEEIVPCFTPGTLIATPRGEVPVERLREGDRVITRDNGIQEIRWIGSKTMDWRSLNQSQHLKPVLIKAGSLGHGLPERDMMVSPNHRMLVANDQTTLYFDEREVLASAKHLVDNKGVMTVDVREVNYIHFLFDHHEVVLSDGTWSESFQPGDYSLAGIGNAQRQELFELFPELETREGIEDFTSARRILKKHEAQMLARGLRK
ncbi:Ig-like domain-containing protein [Maritimibacter dapengensis]|uniref:Tandem-95 repeat protein n=1 Tax=Maritimibacter dapengensis TaxID=2836868 RepID=A0ABS6T2A7_9RHOB|nr:Ig-like domain-containing protein [Maritimibacter dapengensis]MBV7379347.1 tandem-95 repeat protein [Maritimibacter dapengensis]